RSRRKSWKSSVAQRRSPGRGVSCEPRPDIDRFTHDYKGTPMTATLEEQPTTAEGGTGRVVRVIGPVVDVEFAPDEMPEIYNALEVERTLGEDTRTLTLEVAAHIGDNMVRAISMQPTDGLVRGSGAKDQGSPSSVPVGDATLGHVWNVLGEALDVDNATIEVKERWPIHRPSPPI